VWALVELVLLFVLGVVVAGHAANVVLITPKTPRQPPLRGGGKDNPTPPEGQLARGWGRAPPPPSSPAHTSIFF
jgi:hypothetical protein